MFKETKSSSLTSIGKHFAPLPKVKFQIAVIFLNGPSQASFSLFLSFQYGRQ